MKAIACVAALLVLGSCSVESYDIVITNGRVIDGTGRPGLELSIAIRGDSIVRMGPNVRGAAVQTIDARGLVVSPGVIDMHAHSERELVLDGRAASSPRASPRRQRQANRSETGPRIAPNQWSAAIVDGARRAT